ncbi:MAG: hypothetical protein M1816_001438 [Peltula sp. TS41687]|nr:MAG: hypothetical protein M1816_001438 [Peltula sp. TS41687]
MPLALSNMGIVLGVLVIIWAGVTAGFGLYLQTRCARYLQSGSSSFAALSQLTYPNASVVFDAAIAIKCFGVGVSYLIIIGDLMPVVVRAFGPHSKTLQFLDDRHFWVTVIMLIVIPFVFLRRLDSLKYASVVALMAVSYLVVLVTAHYFMGDTIKDRGTVKVFKWAGPLPTLSSFPVVIFAYTCHQNMFGILNELADNSPARTISLIGTSVGSACFTYLLVAITGYLSFGDNVSGNIIRNYPPSTALTICRVAIVLFFMLSYPLQAHPCRASIDAVLKWRPRGRSNKSPRGDSSNLLSSPLAPLRGPTGAHSKCEGTMSETRFAMISTVIIVLSYLVAMTVTSLEKVLAYVGSTGSTAISFILPGLFYYKISDPESVLHQKLIKEDDDDDDVYVSSDGHSSSADENRRRGVAGRSTRRRLTFSNPWRKKFLRRMSLALAAYGLVVMVVCLVSNTFFVVAH